MNELLYEAGASMARLKRDEGLAFQRLAHDFDTLAVPSVEAARAAHVMRSVWTALIRDLASGENGYPTALKVELIGIGISMMREAEGVLEGNAAAAPRLAELCRILSAGLLHQTAPVPSTAEDALRGGPT